MEALANADLFFFFPFLVETGGSGGGSTGVVAEVFPEAGCLLLGTERFKLELVALTAVVACLETSADFAACLASSASNLLWRTATSSLVALRRSEALKQYHDQTLQHTHTLDLTLTSTFVDE